MRKDRVNIILGIVFIIVSAAFLLLGMDDDMVLFLAVLLFFFGIANIVAGLSIKWLRKQVPQKPKSA